MEIKISDEQQAVVEHQGNAVVRCPAGSGKSTTCTFYAKARPSKRLLYIVFNRSAREEGQRRFKKHGINNVDVETAHSLAHKNFDVRNRFRLHEGGSFRVYDILKFCDIRGHDIIEQLTIAKHVQRYLTYYLNSTARTVADADYLGIVPDGPSLDFASTHCETIYTLTRKLCFDMFQGNVPITHDAYLKFFALMDPTLPHDILLCDEAQDLSPVMLGIVQGQRHATRLLIGDSHQAIYGFRHAVDSLSQVDDSFKAFQLQTSYRFPQAIADFAMRALRLKKLVDRYDKEIAIKGAGSSTGIANHAIISRSNIPLLNRAIAFMLETNRRHPVHFEGGFENYTFNSEGASLFDVLYLRLGQTERIRNEFIRAFRYYGALQEYIAQADDRELALAAEVVDKYGRDLFQLIQDLRSIQTAKNATDTIFSTLHRAKGAEFCSVELTEGFITAEKIKKMLANEVQAIAKGQKSKPVDPNVVGEEVNMLYVALTRAKSRLSVPFDIDGQEPNFYFAAQPELQESSSDDLFGDVFRPTCQKKPTWRDRLSPPHSNDPYL